LIYFRSFFQYVPFAVQKSANVGPTILSLGAAINFSVLAGSGISNTGPTTIYEDVGTFPTVTEAGFNDSTGTVILYGINHAGDAVTQAAKNDLLTAYNNAAGQATTQTISADLGGQTLTAGVYTGSPYTNRDSHS
jgi:type VI secretion system secreted protein VgrG